MSFLASACEGEIRLVRQVSACGWKLWAEFRSPSLISVGNLELDRSGKAFTPASDGAAPYHYTLAQSGGIG
jgi:hypothetical protein